MEIAIPSFSMPEPRIAEQQTTSRAWSHRMVTGALSKVLNATLCGPFSALEVRKTLFDMYPDKAPGPDGMSVFFFQKFWDVIEGETVNEFQSAFIPGRLISDNIILSFETLHWIKNRKKGQKGYVALKLAMSKASDRVEWCFLEEMMIWLDLLWLGLRRYAVCDLWRHWRTAWWFVIVLSYMKGPQGQLINFEKSSLSFSPNTNEQAFMSPHVEEKKLQFRYLVERVVHRIQGWGNKFFSVGDKETLIKYVLQAIPTYAMSCFRISKSIWEEMERECANFWWGKEEGRRRLHWKKWRDLCKPKCQGGLGFRHL
ncbi:uncharacterized protein LOC142530663 [Primulina tabacum]|uniref:uncharacterized protein LOC142530663 n=1 Tax=Primulina tabacum TaxID=48773 RepID=UPI003F5953AC